jgi:hypothetical protein
VVQSINLAELRKIALKPPFKIAVFSQTAAGDCETNWRKAGVEVSSFEFTGLEPMLRPTFANHEPPAQIEPVVDWLEQNIPEHAYIRQEHPFPDNVDIKSDKYIETPVWFGPADGLFGILCRPQMVTSHVAVLIGNSSGDPHCGDTTADLARNLAVGGVASFRFDFQGIGDSLIDGVGSHIFEVDRNPDYAAAVDYLEQHGYSQFAVYGLCSGAYHAYQAAVHEQRISYGLFVNLPFFHWVRGFPVEDLVLDVRKPTYFLDRIWTRAFWAYVFYKITHGELHLRQRLAWLRKLKPRTRRRAANIDDDLARRVKMLFIVCEGDISVDVLKQEFGDPPPPGKKVELVPGLNHAMTGAIMRRVVASRFISFLESYPSTTLDIERI